MYPETWLSPSLSFVKTVGTTKQTSLLYIRKNRLDYELLKSRTFCILLYTKITHLTYLLFYKENLN